MKTADDMWKVLQMNKGKNNERYGMTQVYFSTAHNYSANPLKTYHVRKAMRAFYELEAEDRICFDVRATVEARYESGRIIMDGELAMRWSEQKKELELVIMDSEAADAYSRYKELITEGEDAAEKKEETEKSE